MLEKASRLILVVDDDESVRTFLELFLIEAGFEVSTARNGEHGLQQYNERSDEIDLVITDLVMPGMFGDQLALRIREEEPDLPIIFISGFPPPSVETGIVLEVGINYLQKPFSVSDLSTAIEKLIGSPR